MPGSAPTDDLEWATNGGAAVAEPSTGQKQLGYEPGEEPPAHWWNWWKRAVWRWISYFGEKNAAGGIVGLDDTDRRAVVEALTGDAITATGGTGGHGVMSTSGGGDKSGVYAVGGSAGGPGVTAIGGNITGTGDGIIAEGGNTGGAGGKFYAVGGSANGIEAAGHSGGAGVYADGGSNGAGVVGVGGASGGRGGDFTAIGGDADGARGQGAGTGHGVVGEAGGGVASHGGKFNSSGSNGVGCYATSSQGGAVVGITTSSSNAHSAAAFQALSGAYCLILLPDETSPARAPLRITPQNAQPNGAHEVGDMYVTSAGVLKICTVPGTPGTWVSVGSQT